MDSTSNVKVVNGKGKQKKKFKTRDDRLSSSEKRRQKRVSEKQATTTCFACREKGHSARNCPKTGDGDQSKKVVGMCYRCGSTRHTLSRCKKPEDLSNPLPFASCFVCNGKGHLASACPQNRDKGVYPNGGCCKLCGETTHLAKDCDLRKKDTNILARVIGIDDNVGADEDDFHIIGRRKHQLDKDERRMEKSQRLKDVKVGAQSGIIKSFGKVPASLPKKVVYF
ncbi:hypothetical protein K435DRAFT_709696 [Dendrothele bispora CBS 962.96]|uniref:CCHC-type domain-containing protein n=1 Tax=Dendrothele bispora (strain CBS 962.96) TaxID=1314807 RepID=A0A4S8MWD9_DENBC|nr:hypothetical protein K435DRAFT_709696 [Dendrothele bispora CBS 962.96]